MDISEKRFARLKKKAKDRAQRDGDDGDMLAFDNIPVSHTFSCYDYNEPDGYQIEVVMTNGLGSFTLVFSAKELKEIARFAVDAGALTVGFIPTKAKSKS